MKIIVETTGEFGLMSGREEIQHHRPSVVTQTYFTETRTGNGQLKVLCNDVPDSADDKTFAEIYMDCISGAEKDTPLEDTARLAIDSYVAELQAKEDAEAKKAKAAEAKKAKASTTKK